MGKIPGIFIRDRKTVEMWKREISRKQRGRMPSYIKLAIAELERQLSLVKSESKRKKLTGKIEGYKRMLTGNTGGETQGRAILEKKDRPNG